MGPRSGESPLLLCSTQRAHEHLTFLDPKTRPELLLFLQFSNCPLREEEDFSLSNPAQLAAQTDNFCNPSFVIIKHTTVLYCIK